METAASGIEVGSTSAGALMESDTRVVLERQFAGNVLKQVSWIVVFGSWRSVGTAGGSSPLESPCSRRVLDHLLFQVHELSNKRQRIAQRTQYARSRRGQRVHTHLKMRSFRQHYACCKD